jgi:hypothetical protein
MYIRPSFPFRVILCPDLNIFVAALIMGTAGTPYSRGNATASDGNPLLSGR